MKLKQTIKSVVEKGITPLAGKSPKISEATKTILRCSDRARTEVLMKSRTIMYKEQGHEKEREEEKR